MKLFKKLFVITAALALTGCANISMPNKPVDVTGVELNYTSYTLENNKSFQLEAFVKPSNATNKDITWSVRSGANYVSVDETGLVTAKRVGNAVVRVTTLESGYSATCSIKVVAEVIHVQGIALNNTTASVKQGKTLALTATISPSNASNKAVSWTSSNESVATVNSSGYITAISQGTTTITATTADGGFSSSCQVSVTEPVRVTGISLDRSSISLSEQRTATLVAAVAPSDAYDKSYTWSSSNNTIATVSDKGVVTAKSVGTAVITVKSNDGGYTASCNITVTAKSAKDEWTILVYMCGSNLESEYANNSKYGYIGLATSDIKEIISVPNQPEDVNILIETGGCTKWTKNTYAKYSSGYDISNSYNQIHRVENNKIVLEHQFGNKPNMGASSTLQTFLEYGLSNYPADKTALILWNHGGGLQGVCFADIANSQNLSNDGLEAPEVCEAVSKALANNNMAGQKLEFIGYDACLMQVQDIAELNSQYFNYMVGSEESEAGEGWDYDTWVDDVYSGKDTKTVLKAMVDGFIADNGGTSSSKNDQTLSYLDLSYASEYKTAWENMASALKSKVTSSTKSDFNDLVDTVKHYADEDYVGFGLFDAKDFINKLASSSKFNPGSTYTDAVLSAHSKLVGYSSCGKGAGKSYGVCMFWCIDSTYKNVNPYTAGTDTNFTNWAYLSNNFYGSGSGSNWWY